MNSLTQSKSERTHDLRILPGQKEKDVYTLPGHCQNCDWVGTLLIPKGEHAPRKGLAAHDRPATCPRCQVRELIVL